MRTGRGGTVHCHRVYSVSTISYNVIFQGRTLLTHHELHLACLERYSRNDGRGAWQLGGNP
jgi:hypothetical protein